MVTPTKLLKIVGPLFKLVLTTNADSCHLNRATFQAVADTVSTLDNEIVEEIRAGRKENPDNVRRAEFIVSEENFNDLFPRRQKAYTYRRFLQVQCLWTRNEIWVRFITRQLASFPPCAATWARRTSRTRSAGRRWPPCSPTSHRRRATITPVTRSTRSGDRFWTFGLMGFEGGDKFLSDEPSELRVWAAWENRGAQTRVQGVVTTRTARTPTQSQRSGLAEKIGQLASWSNKFFSLSETHNESSFQAGELQEILRTRSEAAELQFQLRSVQPGHVRGGSAAARLPRLCGRHLAQPGLRHLVLHHPPAAQAQHAPRDRRDLAAEWSWPEERNCSGGSRIQYPLVSSLYVCSVQGFGTTINIINGGLECNKPNGKESPQAKNRIAYYKKFAWWEMSSVRLILFCLRTQVPLSFVLLRYLYVDFENEELGCVNQKQFSAGGAGALPIYWDKVHFLACTQLRSCLCQIFLSIYWNKVSVHPSQNKLHFLALSCLWGSCPQTNLLRVLASLKLFYLWLVCLVLELLSVSFNPITPVSKHYQNMDIYSWSTITTPQLQFQSRSFSWVSLILLGRCSI